MTIVKQIICAGAVIAIFASPALAESKSRLGTLSCNVDGGAAFIFGSTRKMICSFKASDGSVRKYAGTIKKFGVDIGVRGKSKMAWVVLSSSNDLPKKGSLAGTYSGVSADASAGVGAGANVLVGGSKKQFSLQPLSLSAGTGVAVSAGVATLELAHVK